MAGKWQFDGGNASIKKFGFDNYLVTNPFEVDASEGTTLRFYKNPQIYEKGAYWPDSLTAGKYGDDLIRNYMFNFIDSNKNKKPFFIYWATNLVHEPFCPTPDDPQFAAWNPNRKKLAGDTIYYPSMVKYMDKLIGQLITKLGNDGLQSNTLVLFLGDNGSSASIHSLWNGQIVSGDKSGTSEAGTHVPMLAFMPGQVLPGAVNNNLVSLVDFMPTIADAGKTNIPAAYGITDGISFAPQFSGNNLSVRPWIFDHFVGSGKFETDPLHLRRWMQDSVYKQYDSLPNLWLSKKFFNIKLDPQEKKAITPGRMTQKEKALSKKYLTNMSQLH
jgi:arylsulfatase A